MNAEYFVRLVEEMTELKVRQLTESHLKHNPELARLAQSQREDARHKLEQVRREMVRCLQS